MLTTMPGRFDLCQEDIMLLQDAFGVADPFFDPLPDEVFTILGEMIDAADSKLARTELEELYDKLIAV